MTHLRRKVCTSVKLGLEGMSRSGGTEGLDLSFRPLIWLAQDENPADAELIANSAGDDDKEMRQAGALQKTGRRSDSHRRAPGSQARPTPAGELAMASRER